MRARARSRERLQILGRALRHRNYRLFFGGQSLSLIGTWITRVATSWLVYRLTGSAWLLGVVGFAGQIPMFFLAPPAGVLVDRWDRHRVLVWTQVLAMVQSALLAAVTLTGVVTLAHVLALSLFQGVINALDMPARQAFVVDMLESRDDLPNAIALNSSMVNVARLLGPSIAGVLIALVGEGGCFALDAASYLPVIGSLLAMRLAPRPARHAPAHALADLRAGLGYVAGVAPIRAILTLLALVSLAGMPYGVLLPIVAAETLHGGAHTYGFLTAGAGLGALAGALRLASRRTVLGLGRVSVLAAGTFGLGLVAFSRSHVLWLSLPLMVVIGAGMMLHVAATNTILQTIVAEDMRGRVMSLYAAAIFGMLPIGSLLAGGLARQIGAADTILAGGTACVLGALWFLRRLPAIQVEARPIYERQGILPEIAAGVESATQSSVPPSV